MSTPVWPPSDQDTEHFQNPRKLTLAAPPLSQCPRVSTVLTYSAIQWNCLDHRVYARLALIGTAKAFAKVLNQFTILTNHFLFAQIFCCSHWKCWTTLLFLVAWPNLWQVFITPWVLNGVQASMAVICHLLVVATTSSLSNMVAHYDFTVTVGVTVDFMVTLPKTKQGHLSRSQQIVICGVTLWAPKAGTISSVSQASRCTIPKSPPKAVWKTVDSKAQKEWERNPGALPTECHDSGPIWNLNQLMVSLYFLGFSCFSKL